MNEFATEISERIAQARQSLAEAETTGDEYLAGVRVGELESLARLAADHGVEVPGLDEHLARHGAAQEIELPAEPARDASLT